MLKRLSTIRVLLLVTAGVLVHFAGSAGTVNASTCNPELPCVPDGSWDDTLYQTDCCSGLAVPGSTYCLNPSDYGTTWASCFQICAPEPLEPDCDNMNQQYPGCNYSYDSAGQCCVPESGSLMCPYEPCLLN